MRGSEPDKSNMYICTLRILAIYGANITNFHCFLKSRCTVFFPVRNLNGHFSKFSKLLPPIPPIHCVGDIISTVFVSRDWNHENINSLNWWLRYAEISWIKCIRNPNDILLFRNSKVGYRVEILCILSLENQYCLSLGGFVFAGFGENGDFGCCKSVMGLTYNLILRQSTNIGAILWLKWW